MTDRIFREITDFGDLALMLPLAGGVLIWLIGMRARLGAVWWTAALALCAGGTAFLKIYFFACPSMPEMHSPSGHTSLSVLVYGTLTLVVGLEAHGWSKFLVIATGVALILGIAESRIALSAHSPIEVVMGLGIGAAALGLFACGYLRYRPAQARLTALLLAVLLTVTALHGSNLRAEGMLQALGGYLRVGEIACS